MNKEAKLMTSWFVGNLLDTAVTHLAVNNGLREFSHGTVNDVLLEDGRLDTQAVVKIGLTVMYTGLFALAHVAPENSKINYKYVTDKTLQIGNLIIWGAVVWNIAQVAINQWSK